jgi:hypothetical protein
VPCKQGPGLNLEIVSFVEKKLYDDYTQIYACMRLGAGPESESPTRVRAHRPNGLGVCAYIQPVRFANLL